MSGGHGHEEHVGHDDHHSAPSGGGDGEKSGLENPVGFAVGMGGATAGVMWGIGKLISAAFRK